MARQMTYKTETHKNLHLTTLIINSLEDIWGETVPFIISMEEEKRRRGREKREKSSRRVEGENQEERHQ